MKKRLARFDTIDPRTALPSQRAKQPKPWMIAKTTTMTAAAIESTSGTLMTNPSDPAWDWV